MRALELALEEAAHARQLEPDALEDDAKEDVDLVHEEAALVGGDGILAAAAAACRRAGASWQPRGRGGARPAALQRAGEEVDDVQEEEELHVVHLVVVHQQEQLRDHQQDEHERCRHAEAQRGRPPPSRTPLLPLHAF